MAAKQASDARTLADAKASLAVANERVRVEMAEFSAMTKRLRADMQNAQLRDETQAKYVEVSRHIKTASDRQTKVDLLEARAQDRIGAAVPPRVVPPAYRPVGGGWRAG